MPGSAYITRTFACLMVVLLTSAPVASAATRIESVVLDQNNPPYSRQRPMPEGLELDVARLIAAHMQVELDIVWTDTLKHGLLSFLVGDESKVTLAVGVPVELTAIEDEARVGDKVLYSIPYASTRYVLVSRKSFPEIPNFHAVGREYVGAELGSVASSRLWDEGFLVQGMASQDELLEAVARGELPYAVLWSNAAWLIGQSERLEEALKVQSAEPDIAGLSWNLAVAVRRGRPDLLKKVNTAIEELRRVNAFEPLFDHYGLPYFQPFTPEKE
ncbi:MAG: transporter substrate-binding domain-containing protein [Candidatus Hydrogenedentes bacterium]|nr:transporter substrate-binding domain-containing protein [Candidatus Hydrogenedentota bacterium]